jgi:hypothetical protein
MWNQLMRLRYAVLCLLLSSTTLSAGEVVFYRCTDAAGALTLQNMPCPKGSRQEKKVMQPVNTVPMGVGSTATAAPAAVPAPATPDPTLSAAPAPDAAAVATSQAPPGDTPLLPPPRLFQCTTHDRDTYITESSEPQSRCVALRTVGLDGNPNTGVGQACEVLRDTCARVADADLCAAWTKRLGETEVAWRFARPGNAAANEADHLRVQRILDETSCAEEREG